MLLDPSADGQRVPIGTTANRRPRDFCMKASHFGRREPALWIKVDDDPLERGQLAGAYFQHRVAYAVIEAVEMEPMLTLEGFAEQLGMKPDTLMRKLYGQNNASIADLMTWSLVLGIDVLPLPESGNDLLPY